MDFAKRNLKHVTPNKAKTFASGEEDSDVANVRKGLKHVTPNASKTFESGKEGSDVAKVRTGLKPAGSIKVASQQAQVSAVDAQSDAARAGLKHVKTNDKKPIVVNAVNDSLVDARNGLKKTSGPKASETFAAGEENDAVNKVRTGLKPAGSTKVKSQQ